MRRRQAAPYLLELDLTQPLLEERPTHPLGRLQRRRRAVLPAVLQALHDGATDPKVCGLVAKVGAQRMGFAQAQDIRSAVAAFRAAGKPAVAWSETFGELAAASVAYYVAAAFDQIWLQPSGEVGFVGVTAGSLFLAEALDRIGVRRQFEARHEYKNAANIFLERSFTEPQREATGRVVASLFNQVMADVAVGRRLDQEAVRSLVDRAPLPARDAHQAGLVDHLGYRDEVYADALGQTSPGAQLLFAHRYHRKQTLPQSLRRAVKRRRGVVALVTGSGTIRLGLSTYGPPSTAAMGSDTVGAALRAAGQDPRVKAVVIRLNSPGGSYIASDAIWREVGRVKDAGKPVVVSMGDVAASGGYFVSAPADAIVAQPGTLTGSIGVLGGKMSFAKLLDRLGIGHDAIAEGRHARMMSALDQFTDEEYQKLSGWLDRVYEDFVAKVAAGRGMTVQAVHEVAKGRVWTGADAHVRGLVDELGGLDHAAALARRRAGLPADAELVRMPRASLAKRLRPPRSSADLGAGLATLDPWGPLTAVAAHLGLPSAGPLIMPPSALRHRL
ncbi:MAG: signal peptide peptidase SppA [Acidimicrobiales bacterium]